MSIKCSRQTAKRFILSKQLLLSPREITGIKGIEAVFDHLRAVQYDPQNPCGRSVDLSLQARVGHIHPSDYYQWLYGQKKGIEVYDKELSVVPIEDLPLCRGVFPKSRRSKLLKFLELNEKELKQLIARVKKEGPICSSDISGSKKVDIFWEPARWSKVALDSLWKAGKLVICHRENGRKYYDLPQRVYGKRFVWKSKSFEDQLHHKCVLRRIQSVGMLTSAGTGAAWLGIGTGKEIKAVLSRLVKQKKLVEIQVDGVKGTYVVFLPDLELLSSLESGKTGRKMSFLSPLDNLLWDRRMVSDIFGFDYKWETYTPVESRKFGHYVLPILYGTEFIGRIEPVLNRDKGVIEIKGLWMEPSFKWDDEARKSFRMCLEEFQKYLGGKHVSWLCKAPR